MIIPAILEKDWSSIEKKLELCREFANTIHIDFIDGKFGPATTFMDFSKFLPYSNYFTLEAHLMVENPVSYLPSLYRAGFKKFLGHIEKMPDQVNFVAKGEELGSVGLALDISTPVDSIKVSLEDLDQILLMSIIAGASGRPFDERVLPKIKNLAAQGLENIEVDGGVNNETLPRLKQAGASEYCVTSFLFNHPNPQDQFRKLEALL